MTAARRVHATAVAVQHLAAAARIRLETTIPRLTAGDTLDHAYCPADPDVGLCGCDISDCDHEPFDVPSCVVCAELEWSDWCPLTGGLCDCCEDDE